MTKIGLAVLALLLVGAATAQEKRDIDRRGAAPPARVTPTPEPEPEPRNAAVARFAGEWTGSYTCVQGVTAMRLVIAPSGGRSLRALMHFFAAPENPDVPEGCFTLTGEIARDGDIALRAERWVVQPKDYIMIGFDGGLARNGELLRGQIVGPKGCTRFRLSREKVSRPLPEACETAAKP